MRKTTAFLLIIFTTQIVLADMTCDTDVSDYFAVYEINSYTCNSGYFLPAGAEGCELCPNGATCAGGTFEYNPDEFQGLVLDTVPATQMNNTCATNFPSDLYAVYEPNTITINWGDGNGGTHATTTCSYGGDIVTPTTAPTAPRGYHFIGWVF